MMSIPNNKSQRQLWASSFVSALPGWVRPDWPRSSRRLGSLGLVQKGFYQPSLDYLESRFVPASILYGNEVALGISPGGAFLIPDDQGKQIGIQFGATDLVYPGNSGVPVSGFAISVNGINYLNYSTTIGLPGTITNISKPGTLAYRFVSEAIPDLKITRVIAMPQNSRQALISTSFENLSSTRSFQNIAIMEVEDPNPATYATLNDVVALSHGTFVRGSNSAGLTLALSSVSESAYGSAFGSNVFRPTDSSPYDFLPSPKGNLNPGSGDPNASSSEDALLRLADQVSSLDPKMVATFSSTLLVGNSVSDVQAAAETLASAPVPVGQFKVIGSPRNETVASEIINFSQPVVGLDAESFQLTRNGVGVPLAGVTLVPLDESRGLSFRLDGLGALTGAEGTYQLSLSGSNTVHDMAGRKLSTLPKIDWVMDTTAPGNIQLDSTLTGIAGVGPDFVDGMLVGKNPGVLSGQGEPGAQVLVVLDGNNIGNPVVDASGKWSCTLDLKDVTDGNHDLSLSQIDPAGNKGPIRTFVLTLDTVAPEFAPTIESVTPDIGVRGDSVSNTRAIVLAGMAETDMTIKVFVGTALLGITKSNEEGNWTLAVSAEGQALLTEGLQIIRANTLDPAGNMSPDSDEFRLTLDTSDPGTVTFDSVMKGIVGVGPEFTDGMLAGTNPVVLSGKAMIGAVLQIALDGDNVGSLFIDTDRKWSLDLDLTGKADGDHVIVLTLIDPEGNQYPDKTYKLTLDTKVPEAPKIAGIEPDTGISSSDQVTSAGLFSIVGQAEADSVVNIWLGGQNIGQANADSNGAWKFTLARALASGEYLFSGTTTDRAMNISPASADFRIVVDTQAPVAPTTVGVTPDKGSGNEHLSNTRAIVFNGKAEANGKVEVYLGNNLLGMAQSDGNGDWSLALSSQSQALLSEGLQAFRARSVDVAGNTSGDSAEFSVTLDLTAPGKVVLDNVLMGIIGTGPDFADGMLAGNNAVVLSGQGEPGARVKVLLDGSNVGEVVVKTSGKWSFDLGLSGKAEGLHDLVLSQEDLAGNGSESRTFKLTLDTQSPALPKVLAIDPDTGISSSDQVTSTGQISVLGQAEAGSQVRVLRDGLFVATVEATANGKWKYTVSSALAMGEYLFSATSTDRAGNTSGESSKLKVVVDTQSPDAPTIVAVTPDKGTGNNHLSNTKALGFVGKSEANSKVEVYLGNNLLGMAQSDGNGDWSLALSSQSQALLSEGLQAFRARSVDVAGNTSGDSAEFSVTLDLTAPGKVVLDNVLTGIIGTGPDFADGMLAGKNAVVLSGQGEPGARVKVLLEGSNVGEVVVKTSGKWSFDLNLSGKPEGLHDLVLSQEDLAGNGSEFRTFKLTLDTQSPASPKVLAIDPDKGISSSDQVTSTGQISVSGQAEAGSWVKLFLDGQSLGELKATDTGAWKFTLSNPLAPGEYMFSAISTDRAGNTSAESTKLKVVVDKQEPAAPTILGVDPEHGSATNHVSNTKALKFVGNSEAGSQVELYLGDNLLGTAQTDANGNWSLLVSTQGQSFLGEGLQVFRAKSMDIAGNKSSDSEEFKVTLDLTAPAKVVLDSYSLSKIVWTAPDISKGIFIGDSSATLFGQGEPGAKVKVLLGGNLLGEAVVSTAGKWSFAMDLSGKAEGIYDLSLSQIDAAGNPSESRVFKVTVDRQSPGEPEFLGIDPDTGVSSHDQVTSTGQISLYGKAEPGSRVILSRDGFFGGDWVEADANGNWRYTLTGALWMGEYVFEALAEDLAKNTSGWSGEFKVVVDTQTPGVPTILAVNPEKGTGNNHLSNTKALGFVGKAEADSKVELYLGNNLLGSTQTDANGNWSLVLSTQGQSFLAEGAQVFRAKSVDVAGNTSGDSAEFQVTVDLTAPNRPLFVGIDKDTGKANDRLTSDEKPLLIGQAEPNSTLKVFLGGTLVGSLTVDGSGDWRWQLPVSLAIGANSFTFLSSDAAGNPSGTTDPVLVQYDPRAPKVPGIDGISGNNPVFGPNNWPGFVSGTLSHTTLDPELGSVDVRISDTTSGLWFDGAEFRSTTPVTLQATTEQTSAGFNWRLNLPASKLVNGHEIQVFVRAVSLAGVNSDMIKATFTCDTVSPTVIIDRGSEAGLGGNLGPILVNVHFSEPINGFDASSVKIPSGVELVSFTGANDTFQVTLRPLQEGIYSITLDGNGVKDQANNRFETESFTIYGDIANKAANAFGLALPPSGQTIYQGEVQSQTDEDWFLLPLNDNGLDVRLSGVTSSLVVEWYDDAGGRLASVNAGPNGAGGVLQIQPRTDARYLRIAGSARSAYTLALTTIGQIPDYQGNTFATAQVISFNNDLLATSGDRTSTDDLEFIRFVASQTGWVTAVVNPGQNSSIHGRLVAFGENENLVAVGQPSGLNGGAAIPIRFPVVAGRTYFLRVDGVVDGLGAGGTGKWELSGTFTQDLAAKTAETGTGTIYGPDVDGEVSVRGAIDTTGDSDLINFQPTESGTYLIRVTPRITATNLVPGIRILGADLKVVTEATGTAGKPLTLVAYLESTKTYPVQFVGMEGSRGAFDALIVHDDFGDTTDKAGLVSGSQGNFSAEGTIELVGDTDLFRLPITQSGFMQILLVGADGSTDEFGFAASQGNPPTEPADFNTGKIEVVAGQDLFLLIKGNDGATGDYRLVLKFVNDDFTDVLDLLDAKSILVAFPQSGSIESFGDRDVFTWTAPADEAALPPFGAYRLLASSDVDEPIDTAVDVYQLDGSGKPQLILSSTDGGQGTDALACFQALPGKVYLFVVRGATGQEKGSYRLLLTEDRLEAGDDYPDSFQLVRLDPRFQLAGDSVLSATGVIHSADDADLVRFVAPSSGTWIIRANAGPGSKLDPYLVLIGSDLKEISSDDDSGSGSNALIVAKLVKGQEYFLEVTSSEGVGSFDLLAKPFAPEPVAVTDDYPADKPGDLGVLGSEQVSVSGKVDFVGDTDSFLLDWPTSTGSASIIARLSPASGSAIDPFLELTDSAGKILAKNDNDGSDPSSILIFEAQPGQKLFLRASGYNRTVGNYVLSVVVLKQAESDDFPGSPEGAPRMVLNSSVVNGAFPVTVYEGKEAGIIGQVGDRDFVEVVAPTDGFLTAKVRAAKSSTVNPYLQAFTKDENGAIQLVALDDNSGGGLDSLIQIPVMAGEVVYLQASGAVGSTGNYTFEVSVRPDDVGDLPVSGADLSVKGLRSSASGTIEVKSDMDLFVYRPSKTGLITVNLNALTESLNPYLFFYRASDGALLQSNNDTSTTNKNSQVQLEVLSGETYWVVALSARGSTGDYSLEIKPVVDDFGNSAEFARPLPIGADKSATIEGKIDVIGDTDWIRIVPSVDGNIRIRASGIGAEPVDPTLAIYTDAGQLIGTADDSIIDGKPDPSCSLEIGVLAGRTYLVKVSGYGEETGGWKVDITPGSSRIDDFGNTFDMAELLELSESGMTEFQGFVDQNDQDVARFLVPVDGQVVVDFSGKGGVFRAFVRDGEQTLQVGSGSFIEAGNKVQFGVSKGQEVFLVAVAPKTPDFPGSNFSVKVTLEPPIQTDVKPVGGDVVSAVEGTLGNKFAGLITEGDTEEDFQRIRDEITQSLIESFKAASGGKLLTSYLLIWLDPVDFVVTDAASQQIGNTATQGAINENSAATLSQKGALDLVIIPGAQASTYSMQLYGVGGGRVLAGASMVQADGTVVNPTVSMSGTQVASGVPVGSVSKEGLTLSLDFRADQVISETPQGTTATTSVAVAGPASVASQQIVGSLLGSMGIGAGNVAVAMADGAELPITDLLVLLMGDGRVSTTDFNGGDSADLVSVFSAEEKQFIKLVNDLVAEIRDAMSAAGRFFSSKTPVGPSEMVAILRKTLERLGFDGAQTVIDKVGQEAGELLAGMINGPVRMELVNKPLNRLLTTVLAEIKSLKGNTPATTPRIHPANANQQPSKKAAMISPEQVPHTEMGVSPANYTSTYMAMGTLGPVSATFDQLWMEDLALLPVEPISQSVPVAIPFEKTDPTDRIWGLVAAAMLAPSWVRSVAPANKKRSRYDDLPIQLSENSTFQ